jgi:hypothetical protein
MIALLGMACMETWAAGFVSLPSIGFQIEGGYSAYTLCNNSSNFGAGKGIKASLGVNDECAIFPVTEIASPLPGFKPVTTASHPIVVNNNFTGGKDIKIGNVTELVWRNVERAECIFGTRVVTTLGDVDYDAARPGKQYFRISDISRAGFAGLPVEIAYSANGEVAKPLYRAGRTFTAVQYRGVHDAPAPGYMTRPPTTPAYSLAINGVNSIAPESVTSTPTPSQQSASLDDNWVTFTTYVTTLDESKKTSAASAMFYVKSPCSNEIPKVLPHAIRLRQTVAPFIEVSTPGFVPTGGHANPPPVVPF